MPLKLSFAVEDDAPRIGDIHMAAFATNEMLLAQFPTPIIREALREAVARKAADDIRDPHTSVLLVQDTELRDEVISYAKWSQPTSTDKNEAPWVWPEGTRLDILDRWTERVETAKTNVLGERSCYRLTFIAAHPDHERRGAASLLIEWALERCLRENICAYLESTPLAGQLYQRLGFTPEENISMSFDDGSAYQEVGYVYRPSKTMPNFPR